MRNRDAPTQVPAPLSAITRPRGVADQARPHGRRLALKARGGFTVALLGPDGAGKSSVSAQVASDLEVPTHRVYMGVNHEASELLLPTTRFVHFLQRHRPRRGRAAATEPLPHGTGRDRRRLSLGGSVRTLNLIAEEWFRQFVVWRHRRRGEVVLLDRHFLFDYHASDVAPQERLPLPRRLHGWLLRRHYPRPDLAIVLDAPGEVMFARKGEGTIAWLEGRRAEYLALRTFAPRSAVVDAAQPLENVIAEVMDLIREHVDLHCRAEGRQHPPGDISA